MSKIYGLTGGIAAGKSTVSQLFQARGYKVYDADVVAREVVEPGTIGLARITQEFGEDILQADGTLDRAKLGSIVFGHPEQLERLNRITRPIIKDKILQIIAETKKSSARTISIFEIQLLFEGDYQSYFDGVIAIYVDPKIQLQRLMKRNNLTTKVALDRINSQMPMAEKRDRADFVIDNSGDLKQLARELDKLIVQL